jgi:hypothetical protein
MPYSSLCETDRAAIRRALAGIGIEMQELPCGCVRFVKACGYQDMDVNPQKLLGALQPTGFTINSWSINVDGSLDGQLTSIA